jgi:predicted AAA+ superfamily ATPase
MQGFSKSPKLPLSYVNRVPVVHSLLGITTREQRHPIAGKTWEGFVVDSLLSCADTRVSASYYRTTGGAEIDLLLQVAACEVWAIEIKRSLSPIVEKGFHLACQDLKPGRQFVVYPETERYAVGADVEAQG